MSLKKIYNSLNMTPERGLCIIKDGQWKGKIPRRLEYLIDKKLKPDAFFCLDKKPLILFYDSPQNKPELFKAIWNFNESPVVIINELNAVEILNGFSYLKDKAELDTLEEQSNLNNFSYFELVTGESLGQYQTKLKQQNRVDFNLLENIRDARNILINDHNIEDSLANALIGKCIFVRYLIDRGVKIKFDSKLRKWTNNEFCGLFDNKVKLIKFFKYLRTQFNGEAFLLNDSKLQDIPQEAFSVLKDLLMGTSLTRCQPSLFDIYDFSIIPVEFISNVYEHFIGKENQAEKGAYYTPKFLVDYILSETVENYFEANPKQYNCKVLDPACGSGIFLVETLRRIIEQYLAVNNNKISRNILKKLTQENIFGIDKDKNAINIAIFSIYLVLLDYQKPKEINNFSFPNLIKNGNFYTADFFDTNAKYNSLFSKTFFDFILGNPPWKRGASQDNLFLKYIAARKQKENKNTPEICISNKEIAQAFLLRVSDFSSKSTKCALIVTSKTLYNLNAKKFRRYLLHNFFIDKVFELAPVRREIFDKSNDEAIAPAAILFFRFSHNRDTGSNELIHLCLKPNYLFSLFRIFVLQRTDIKTVVQERLMEYDWLWKVLVYGNYLDFNFIKRLKKDYRVFSDIIKMKSFAIGEGVIVGRQGTHDMKDYMGVPFIKADHLSLFFVYCDKSSKWRQRFVHRDRINNKIIFKSPALLISRGINKSFRAKAAISYKDSVFTHSLTAIKTDIQNIDILRMANGIMSSDIFSYFVLLLASSAGIEREQLHDKERTNFPFIKNCRIVKNVKQIEEISTQLYEENQKIINPKLSELESKKGKLINRLNNQILKIFDLNKLELALVDYAINITIPLITRQGEDKSLFSHIPFEDYLLNEYVKIFLSRFKDSFYKKYLKAEVWHTANIIGIFFNVEPNSSSNKTVIKHYQRQNEDILKKAIALGTTKITDKLFIQKDIRGFEKNGFYIIKPNEKQLWHKAIAYMDVDEFMNEILKVRTRDI